MSESFLAVDQYGNRKIARKNEDGEYEYLSDMVAHLAWEVFDDIVGITKGKKSKDGTEIELKISALNALANAASLER